MNTREFFDVYRGYRDPALQADRAPELVVRVLRRVLIVLSLLGIFVRGFNFSIDFEGGARISYPTRGPRSRCRMSRRRWRGSATRTRRCRSSAATRADPVGVAVRHGRVGAGQRLRARRDASGASASASPGATEGSGTSDATTGLLTALAKQAGVAYTDVNVEDIGPTWGQEISKKAIRGLIVVLVAITLYIAFRFEWTMAAGAMIALVHDVTITAGVYALTGREVTPETVIAILTILGFSLYDTVVIYDKIKENTESPALLARMGYTKVVDLSLNQTVMRSVNTSLVVLLPILSLLLFGGETLKNFAFAMFIGVAIGAYSSIFIAAPLLTVMKERQQAKQPRTASARRGPAAEAGGGRPRRGGRRSRARRPTPRHGARPRDRDGSARSRPAKKRRPPAKRKRR